jgi:diguanylate cyclase (GGDEF)-like protein/PAS domain S-box-containing protein
MTNDALPQDDGPVGAHDAVDALRDAPDYASLVATSADMVTVVGPAGQYLYCSPASKEAFGWEPGALMGRREEDFVHPDDVPVLLSARSAPSPSGRVTTKYRFLCRDGSFRWVEAILRRRSAGGSPVVVNAVRDITERQVEISALERQATTDPLTGVANRAVLMDRLHQGLRRLGRSPGEAIAVLYLDLDRFKVINDSLGHRIGDDVLLKMAERLSHHLRPADTLARLGGDEFVLIAEVANEAAAVSLANRMVEDGRTPFKIDGEEIVCTMSVGVVCTTDARRNAEELLSEADLALYRAKDHGRDRVAVFDEELRTTAVDRMATERMVRRALDEKRIVVEYQPIVDLDSGRPVSAEALVRIAAAGGALRLPASFLGVAEESGLLIAIDEVVLADAVKQAAAWRARLEGPDRGVAVNVTARHLADASFRQAVSEQLSTYGVPPANLYIEVTERVLMEASNSAMTGLRALRDLGVQVGLDDFGTGYSSLAYLQRFPLDFVKIDKSFIDNLVSEPRVRAIVAAIIVLAHALGLTVIAEGVETPLQGEALQDLSCDQAQGFLYAASGRPEELDLFFSDDKRPAHNPTPPHSARTAAA